MSVLVLCQILSKMCIGHWKNYISLAVFSNKADFPGQHMFYYHAADQMMAYAFCFVYLVILHYLITEHFV